MAMVNITDPFIINRESVQAIRINSLLILVVRAVMSNSYVHTVNEIYRARVIL